MKIKTSVTLSEDVLRDLDRPADKHRDRSELIEVALREYLAGRAREIRDAKDLDILNKNAEDLNREAEDVLSYQVELL
ncbi:MAG: ribbon-helix-helix protein, CopG family [Pseudomonadota bacterium]